MKDLLKKIGAAVSVHLLTKDDITMLEVSAESGYIGKHFAAGQKLELALFLPTGTKDVTVFRVAKCGEVLKHITPAKGTPCENGNPFIYSTQTMSVNKVDAGHTCPHALQNGIWVLFTDPDGAFQVGRVEVVSQDGRYFVSTHTYYAGTCYRGLNGVVVPRFTLVPELHYKEWPDLVALLSEKLAEASLPALGTYVQPGPPDVSRLKENEGLVIFWAPKSWGGYGCVETPQGNAQVHYSKIITDTEEEHRHLTAGDLVTITRLEETPPGGPDAHSPEKGVQLQVDGHRRPRRCRGPAHEDAPHPRRVINIVLPRLLSSPPSDTVPSRGAFFVSYEITNSYEITKKYETTKFSYFRSFFARLPSPFCILIIKKYLNPNQVSNLKEII